MKDYTVVMITPDYVACNYGEDSYVAWVKAKSVKSAVTKAQKEAARATNSTGDHEDFFVVFMCEGSLNDITPRY